MVARSPGRSLTFAVTALLSLGLAGCTYVADHRFPPPQASYHHHYDYYYYPHWDVYFHLYSGYYYYRDRGSWHHAKVLPNRYHLDGRHRRLLVIKDKEPYLQHREHGQAYRPPGARDYDAKRDRQERSHNFREHQEYRKRYERR